MDSVLTSTFNGALSQRVDFTTVNPSSLDVSSAAEASTDRGGGQFGAIEMDFEARNWRQARDVVQYKRGHKDKKAMAEFLSRQESPEQAKESCLEASKRASGQYAPVIGGVLSKMEAFMKVGDVAMKGAPESVGLAWMGIRLCMHSVEDDFSTFQLFGGAAGDIIGILISCRMYGKIYGADRGPKGRQEFQELHQKVVDFIPIIYTDILEFSYQMGKQIGRHTGVRLLKGLLSSAANKFGGMIAGLKRSEKAMSEYASKAFEQLSIHYQELGLQKQNTTLENQRAMMSDMAVIKETIDSNLDLQNKFMDHIKRVEEEMKTMKKKTPLDEAKEKFVENELRLKPTNSSEIAFERNKTRREQGTCEWIFELEDYKSWRTSSSNSIIWVSGVGGMGKSILISSVIERLQSELKDSEDSLLQYIICSRAGDDATRLSFRIKEQLVYQLYKLSKLQESADVVKKANQFVTDYLDKSDVKNTSQQKKATVIPFEDVYPSLAKLFEKKIYLIIDALDECDDRKDSHFLKTLQNMLFLPDFPDFRLHVLICSRPEADVVDDLAGKPIIRIEDHNGSDIEHAANRKLSALPGFSPAERALASQAIVKKAKGLFRCVDPAVEFLKKPLQRPLERALERLPDGLDNSYQQILSQTDPEYLELLKTSLRWSILCKRSPTVAEVMDDYSCAYAQEDGSDSNPYDDLEDSSKPEETRRLVADQIRAAGSSTFLEVLENRVRIRHTTVQDFFLRPITSAQTPTNDCEDSRCPSCRSRSANARAWTLTQKEGQLQMALTIFRHLNSALFRKRYLPEEPGTTSSAQPANDQISTNGAVTEVIEEPLPNDHIAGHNENRTIVTNDFSSSLNGEVELDKPGQDTELPHPNLSTAIMLQQIIEPIDTINAIEKTPGSAKDAIEAFQAEASDVEQDHLSDDENLAQDEDLNSINSDSYLSEGPGDDADDSRPARYELTHWQWHLHAAEELWAREERLSSGDWKELWELTLRFLCKNPDAFETWQRKCLGLPASYELDDVVMNPIQVAAAYGLTGLCEILIQHGQSAATEMEDGRSVLWFAAEHDNFELLKLLLENGADPNAHKSWQSPFHKLLWLNPKLDLVKLMVEYKADCRLGYSDGWTAIQWFAIGGSDIEVLKLLLANGGEINAADENGETALHKITWQNPLPIPLFKAFIENGADVNLPDRESQQPLYELCLQGLVEGAQILLDHGADIEDADISGITALHIAATNGHLDVIRLLVDRKASLLKQDSHQRTPFYIACANNHLECARYLLKAAHDQGHHESIHQPVDDGRTPFSKACGRGNLDVVKMLLSHSDANIDVNAVEGASQRTALHWASYNGRVDVVLLLLESGANATIADASGKTALALSGAGWGKDKTLRREQMILALIEQDRSTAAQDTDLMAIAAIRGSAGVLEKLLDAKAHPSKQDEHGWTPLQLARQYGNTDAAAVLAKHGAVVGSKPSKWVTEHKQVRLLEDGSGLEFVGPAKEWERFMVLANHPIPAGIERFYFEVEINATLGRDQDLSIAIGFATQPARLNQMPGWFNPLAPSWAFHGDDGRIFANSDQSTLDYAEYYGKGAVIGCGVIFHNGIDGNVFYTRDGKALGIAFDSGVRGRLYPAVGMAEPVGLVANWGNDVERRPFKWACANRGRYELEDIEVENENKEPSNTILAVNVRQEPSLPS